MLRPLTLATCLVVALPAAAAAQCAHPFFAGNTVKFTGDAPRTVITGDFDRDGNADLLVGAASGLFLHRGDGARDFAAPTSIGVTGTPWAMAAADLNADGNADVAVVCRSDATVKILLGDGNGGFTVAQSVPVLESPNDVVLADLDQDGALDFATSHDIPLPYTTDGGWSVSLGLAEDGVGTGAFAAASSVRTNNGGESLVAGDYDEDGDLDLVLSTLGPELRVLRGAGDGTFEPELFSYENVAPDYDHLLALHLDGDGHLDLASASLNTFRVSKGTGEATFGLGSAVGGAYAKVVSGDWNHDGHVDLGAVSPQGQKFVYAVNDGGGGLVRQASYEFLALGTPLDVVADDFDDDGALDLAIVSHQYDVVSVVHGTCTSPTTDVSDAAAASPVLRVLRASRRSLEVELRAEASTRLELLDVAGRRVAEPLALDPAPAARRVVWSLDDVRAGVYFVRLVGGTTSAVSRVAITD